MLWGGCDPLFTPRPLGPLFAIAEYAGGELEEVVQRGVLPHEVVAALARELQARAPTVFVLEDLHWADEATLDVLRLLARRVETVPALIVASYRDDELDRAHPLRIVLGELATNRAVARLRLAPLSPAAVAQLAEPHGVDSDELYRKTAGNPFFVVEALAAQGDEIPDTVRDAVLRPRGAAQPTPRGSCSRRSRSCRRQAELWLLEALAGEAIDGLDECLASGMLDARARGRGVPARARPPRRRGVGRRSTGGSSCTDRRSQRSRIRPAARAIWRGSRITPRRPATPTRCCRFAPAAAAGAASLGAHREAAAQYARALRFARRLAAAERAELLERRSRECFLTDQYDEGIAALEAGARDPPSAGRQAQGGRRAPSALGVPLVPGPDGGIRRMRPRGGRAARTSAARPRARAGRTPTSRSNCLSAARCEEAIAWGERALELAERLDDREIERPRARDDRRVHATYGQLEQSLERALRAGLSDAGRRRCSSCSPSSPSSSAATPEASRHLEAGIEYCSERGLELFRLYLLAFRARLELDQGRWSEAADSAAAVLRVPLTSTRPRIERARRPRARARPPRGPGGVAAARRGVGRWRSPPTSCRGSGRWRPQEPRLPGSRATAMACTRRPRPRFSSPASGRPRGWSASSPCGAGTPASRWRSRRRRRSRTRCSSTGDAIEAAELWRQLGCPYEAALALADADEEEPLRRALDELQALGAGPRPRSSRAGCASAACAESRAGHVRATRENPAGLTARELEVLALLADGLRNAQIAERLFVSAKTVDHHVSAILRKLDVRTRGEAGAAAARLGLIGPR